MYTLTHQQPVNGQRNCHTIKSPTRVANDEDRSPIFDVVHSNVDRRIPRNRRDLTWLSWRVVFRYVFSFSFYAALRTLHVHVPNPIFAFAQHGSDQGQKGRLQQELANTQPRVHHTEPCRHRVLRGDGHCYRSHGPSKSGWTLPVTKINFVCLCSLTSVSDHFTGVLVVCGPTIRPGHGTKSKCLASIWYRNKGFVLYVLLFPHLHHIPRHHSRIYFGRKSRNGHILNDNLLLVFISFQFVCNIIFINITPEI